METKRPAQQTNPIEQFGTAPNLMPHIKQADHSGVLLKDRYLIEGELGRGGIGVVYLARDTKLMQRRVVIKVLLESSDNSLHTPWIRKKFEQEVEALVRIDHPGVVGVLDIGEMPDGKPFFVMQFVEGTTLRAVIEQELPGKLDAARVAHIVRQIGLALTAAHEKGIIHRDLKPENVMVQKTSEGEEVVKLIDFGIATVKDSQANRGQTETGKTKVAGALPYMAPEQLRGEPVAASDTWSLGVMAYELLTGQIPFTAETMVQMHEQQRTGVTTLLNHLPAAAVPVITRVLSFDPEQRHARARDFGDAISEALLDAIPRTVPTAAQGKLPSAPTLLDFKEAVPNAPATTIAPDFKLNEAVPNAPATTIAPDFKLKEAVPDAPKTTIAPDFKLKEAVPDAPKTTIAPNFKIPSYAADETGILVTPAPRRTPWAAIGLAFVGLALLIGVIAYWQKSGATTTQTEQTTTVTKPARTLSYSLSVRLKKNTSGAPIEMAGEVVFSPGDELRFKLISPQDGYLYIIGEAPQPDQKTGTPLYNLLFPKQNAANAQISANQMVYLPSETGSGFFVDKEQGSEKIWFVWSQDNVAELEQLKRWYNDKDKGAINDSAEADKLRAFLSNTAARPVAEKDAKQMTLKGGLSDLLIYPLELAHY